MCPSSQKAIKYVLVEDDIATSATYDTSINASFWTWTWIKFNGTESIDARARAGKRKGQFACDFVVSNSCAVPADKSFSHLRPTITRSIILFIGADERKRLIFGRSIFHPGGVFGWVRPEKDTRAQNNRKWVAPRSRLACAYHFTFIFLVREFLQCVRFSYSYRGWRPEPPEAVHIAQTIMQFRQKEIKVKGC